MAFLRPATVAPARRGRKRDPYQGVTPEAMQAAGCDGCPLAEEPKAQPSGALPCDVYMLGEAPGSREASVGEPFVGPSGQLLRRMVPEAWREAVRYNNVVMSWPPRKEGKQTAPSPIAMAHCRGYLIADIEAARPRAIFGFGNTPLAALTGQSGITKFAGRKLPVQVGSHRCWYFAFLHPASILHAHPREQEGLKAALAHQIRVAFSKVDTLPPPAMEGGDEARAGVRVVVDAEQVVQLLLQARKLDRVGLDYETSGLSPYAPGARLLSAAVAMGEETFAFPLDHREAPWSQNERSAISVALQGFLEAKVVKVAHHAAFEMLWTLDRFGKRAVRPNRWADSLAQAFLLDSRPKAHSLDFLCQVHFGLALKAVSDLDVANLDAAPLEQVLLYNGMDAKYCLRVFETQEAALQRTNLMPLYHHHMARVAALVRGQHLGLPLDAKVNATLTSQYRWRQAKIERRLNQHPEVKAFEADGAPFNIGSTHHVARVLGIDTRQRFSTDEKVLLGLGTPLAKEVLAWRNVAKTLSTYLVPFGSEAKKPMVYAGLLHPYIGTTNTRTWRTSADNPNIQNFPKRDHTDKLVRKQIVAPPGTRMLCVDYSSIQARNVAMESCDRRLVQAFIDRYDIHSDWSERIQRQAKGWAKRRDAKALRNAAKNELVFPLFFGAQPASVAGYLGIDVSHGYKLYNDFWTEFPEIHGWHNKLKRFYAQNHYVTGLSGFRRRAPISENQLINSPIQADEALLVCEALVRLSGYEDDALQPVALIHDDLSFFIPEQRLDECIDIILQEMLRCEHTWLNVPLAVEVSIGQNWCELDKVGHYESTGVGGYVEIG